MNVDLLIVKFNNIWRVIDKKNPTKKEIIIKRDKDTVTWHTKGTDAYFQFSHNYFQKKQSKDSRRGIYTMFLKDDDEITLKVKTNAEIPKKVVEVYAVFCKADNVFARGSTPPKLIVK